ncbi:MAG: fibronectin type III domain-containing protein [Nanoarchaeota archaeon]
MESSTSNYDVPNVIAIASTNHNDLKAGSSNYGAATVDLGAPGVNIYSTVPTSSCAYCNPSGFTYLSGTSMATPHVSGAAALIKAKYPSITYTQIKSRLLSSVDRVPSMSGITLTGGRLNAFKALEDDSIAPSSIGDLTITGNEISTVVLTWTAVGDDNSIGIASEYDLRYSKVPIDDINFASSKRALSVTAPKAAGSVESFTINNLESSTTYYFAIKAIDNVGNFGPISNIAVATTKLGSVLFQDNFESGLNGWAVNGTSFGTTNGTNGTNTTGYLWHLETAKYNSPTTSWTYNKGFPGYTYNTGARSLGDLTSPLISLSSQSLISLSFYDYYETETADTLYDKRIIQISVNNGPYAVLAQLSNDEMNVWHRHEISLTPYLGNDVRIQFYFDSIDNINNDYWGWSIDDFAVTADNVILPLPIISNIEKNHVFDSDLFTQQITWTTDTDTKSTFFYRKKGTATFSSEDTFGTNHMFTISSALEPGDYEYYIKATNFDGGSSTADNNGSNFGFTALGIQLVNQNGFTKKATFPQSVEVYSTLPEYDLNHNNKKEFLLKEGNYFDSAVFGIYENQIGDAFNKVHQLNLAGDLYAPYISDADDADNDKLTDILFIGRDGNTFVAKLFESLSASSYPTNSVWSTIFDRFTIDGRVGDLDSDGGKDIIFAHNSPILIGDSTSKINIFENSGNNIFTNVYGLVIQMKNNQLQSIDICNDLDNDGKKEFIIAGTDEINVFENTIDNDYSLVWTSPLRANDLGPILPGSVINLINGEHVKCFDNIDNDGMKGFIVGGLKVNHFSDPNFFDYYKIYKAASDNQFEETSTIKVSSSQTYDNAVQAGDFDGDGKKEIAIVAGSKDLYLIKTFGNGTLAPVWYHTWVRPEIALYDSKIGTGDYDNDYKGEVIFNEFSDGVVSTVVYESDTSIPPEDTTPPNIEIIVIQDLNSNSAKVVWTTNESSDSQVEYGLDTNYGSTTPLDTNLVTSHSAILSNLMPSTTYHYRVKSGDASGNLAVSDDRSFATLSTDTTPPQIYLVYYNKVKSNEVKVYWNTDEPADTQLEYGLDTSYGTLTPLDPVLVTSHFQLVAGLNPSTLYHYRVRARDAAGNLGLSQEDYIFETAPTVLGASSSTNKKVIVSFTGSVDYVSSTNISNYMINNGVNAISAALDNNNKTVVLTTSPHASGGTYNVTVSNVKDPRGGEVTPVTVSYQVPFISLGDLITSSITSSTTTIAPGSYFSFSNTVKNVGDSLINSTFYVGFSLSADNVFGGSDDIKLANRTITAPIAVNANNTAYTYSRIPVNAPLGDYFLCAMSDFTNRINESDEVNNALCTNVKIKVTRPDLIVESIMPNNTTVAIGKSLPVLNSIKNLGLVAANQFSVRFSLSNNTVYGDIDDVLISTPRFVGYLAPGASSFANTYIIVPATTKVGSYYVCGKADAGNNVIETNELNNMRCTNSTIAVI